jgi:hypothetical protein
MALTMRATGLGSGIDKDRPDYTVYCGEWNVGRIYETRGGPDSLRWFWSLTVNGPMTRADRVATLEDAKAQFQKSWDAWKAWAKLGRGALTPLSSLAAITNRRRFFVNLLCGVTRFRRGGVTRFRRDRYLCWSCICGWHGNDLIGTRFGDASSQSQELNRCCVLGLES